MKIIIALIACIRVLLALLPNITAENLYARYAVAMDHAENVTILEDAEGNLWDVHDGIPEGVYCILIMDNMRTENITDDQIKRILPLESEYSFNGKIALMDSSKITAEILENRNGALIVERVIGKVLNGNQDGKALNAVEEGFDYISYRGTHFNPGDVVETFLIHDPAGNDVDEITERFDFRIF